MRVIKYDSIHSFMEDTFEVLALYELENNLIIGNLIKAQKKIVSSENWFLATVVDTYKSIQLIAMITPPYPLLLFEKDFKPNDEALMTLIDYLIMNEIKIPGVVTESKLAKRFTDYFIHKKNRSYSMGKHMRIYRLDQVNERINVQGHLRHSTDHDLHFLPYWSDTFAKECHLNDLSIDLMKQYEKIKKYNKLGQFYIYENEQPVSMVAAGRETLNGIVINYVYTPPFFRNKGYATAMVSDLCNHLLNNGYKFCSLFTDLKNPISNSIYQKIGFYPICDYDEYWFN